MRAVLVALAFLVAAPAAAEATTRYAAPGASGATCTVDDKCAIESAVSGAGANDEVVLTSGDYGSVATPLPGAITSTAASLTVHGEDGKPRPRIFTGAPIGLDIRGTGSRVRDLEIDQVSTQGNKVGLDFDGAEATRLVVHDTSPNGIACVILADSTLSDSVCDETGQGGWAVRGYNVNPATNHCVLRNVTALAPKGNAIAVVSAMDVDEDITVTNSIAIGGGPSNGSDVYAFAQEGGGTARISIDHSYYFIRNVRPTQTGPSGIIQDDGTNVRGPQPKFAAPGDYHQAADSSSIDRGASADANGPIDLDGDPRALGKSTDIGADELVPPPSAVTGAAEAITTTDARVNGSVNPNSAATAYRFEFGTTTAYGASTPETDAGSGTAAVPVSASLTGLAPATTYHYRLVAASARGTTLGQDRTLTTQQSGAGPGPGGGGGTTAKFAGPLTLKPSVFAAAARGASVRAAARRRRVGTLASFKLSSAALVTLRVERCVKRRKSRCTRFKRLRGSPHIAGVAGANRFHFSGRLKGKKLKPGRYRLVATVGAPVSTRRAAFRIVRRR
jgi:hypothetical protein